MKCWAIPVGILETNCYVITKDDSNCVIVDPGGDPETILSFLKEHELTCCGVLLTHGHDDHIGALREILCSTDSEVWVGRGDAYRLKSAPNHIVKDGEKIELGGMVFYVVEVPGHTEGSVLYLCDQIMFSGDTLFYRSIGRTDLPGGDWETMHDSLEKILRLNVDYRVLPGHGPSTSLSDEKERNPFLQ